MRKNAEKVLVVIPSDPIAAYDQKGLTSLESYFNPQKFFDRVHVLSPHEKKAYEKHGVSIHPTTISRFREDLEKLNPSLLRAYGGYWAADLAACKKPADIPVIVSVHDTNMVHAAVRYADMVICMSQAVAGKVRGKGTAPARIHLLPNRVNTSLFRPFDQAGKKAAQEEMARRFRPGRMIVHIGRKTRQKNLETVIRALSLLSADTYIVFVGHGHAKPYQELAQTCGVADRCFWLESVQNDELPMFYNAAEVMCTPSRWEGFGIVFIEAAACGARIVTSDIGPMNEFLQHEQSALLVKDYENPDVLAAAVSKVLNDETLARNLGKGARDMAQQFDKDKIDADEVALYRKALSLTPRRLDLVARVHAFCNFWRHYLPWRAKLAVLKWWRSR